MKQTFGESIIVLEENSDYLYSWKGIKFRSHKGKFEYIKKFKVAFRE